MANDRFKRQFDAVAELAREKKRSLVLGHIDPDGDCIGSMLAVSSWLLDWGAKVACFVPGEVPEIYRTLPLARLLIEEEDLEKFCPELIIALDSPTTERTASLVKKPNGVPTVNIDHHPTNESYADINIVDENASAAAVLVYRLLSQVSPDSLTAEVSGYLYIGILMDTGGFRFRSTNSEALSVAAHLVELGAQPHELAHDFLYARKLSTLKLLSLALGSLEVFAEGRIALMEISQRMLRKAFGSMSDTEGFVDYCASIDDVELAALFREISEQEIRVSLRSRNDFDVASLAEKFGGGGHRNAAGLTIKRNLSYAKKVIRLSLESMLERRQPHGGS